jgi:threonine/homoserine/homoserine lactone efflux protein
VLGLTHADGAQLFMGKSRIVLWFYVVTGILWLLVGVLRLVQHDSSILMNVFDFVAGSIFLLLAWQQLNRCRAIDDHHA